MRARARARLEKEQEQEQEQEQEKEQEREQGQEQEQEQQIRAKTNLKKAYHEWRVKEEFLVLSRSPRTQHEPISCQIHIHQTNHFIQKKDYSN